jgi:hypothetical protein
MKNLIIVLLIGFALYATVENNPQLIARFSQEQKDAADDQQIVKAFQNRQSDVQVTGSGVVIKTLSDDTSGSRHQKFILRLASGQTLLIAHNIDLAQRIDSLREGDIVEFNGEYEWNSKGGVLHWTHRDPAGRHEGGWLKHGETVYQ